MNTVDTWVNDRLKELHKRCKTSYEALRYAKAKGWLLIKDICSYNLASSLLEQIIKEFPPLRGYK